MSLLGLIFPYLPITMYELGVTR